jgi:hypothetical protein
MLTLVAFSTCQLNVDELPETIVAGVAVKLSMRGDVPAVTATVTWQVVGPVALAAVNM